MISEELNALRRKPSIVYWLDDKLYLNITNQCPNNCYFCLRKYRNGINNFILKLPYEPSSKEIIRELQNYINRKIWKELVFCGFGEPTARLNCLLEVANWAKKFSWIPIRLNTNGQAYLLNPNREVISELNKAGISRVSVSLNTHNNETYKQICKPKFEGAYQQVLEFIRKAKQLMDVEITAVQLPELNIKEMEKLAEKLGVKFRLRPYIPCFY